MRVNKRVVTDIETGRLLSRKSFDYLGPIARAMGVRFPTVASTTFVGPFPANATETVVLTTPGLNEPIDNAQVLIFWMLAFLAGTSMTGIGFKIRRGTTTGGTQVNVGTLGFPVVAANNYTMSGWYVDSPGVVAGQQYSLTASQTAATVASTFNDGAMIAMVL